MRRNRRDQKYKTGPCIIRLVQLYVLIRPLYVLIHDLINKELTGCSERIVSIKHRRQIWGAMIVKIVNMQRLEIG